MTSALLLLLAGCHRAAVDRPAAGADAQGQARTAAKTLADLAAADRAARRPLPDEDADPAR